MDKYVDVHAHLTEKIFDKDREDVIKDCSDKGIEVVTCGTSKKTNRKVLELVKNHKNVHACLGFYPVDLLKVTEKEFFEELRFIEKNKDKIVGIGEVGLDFHWVQKESERKKEVERFKEIVWLANRLNLPLNVHTRDAEKESLALLIKSAHVPVILHCFNGSPELIRLAVKNGFYISTPANIWYNKRRQRLVKEIPLTNLLTETDSPYLGPKPKERNDPRNILLSMKKIAEVKELPEKTIKKQVWENAKKVFGFD